MSLTATTVAAGLAELEQLARAFDPEATVAAAAQLLQSPELIGRARGRALYLYGRALYRIERFPQGTEAMRQAQAIDGVASDRKEMPGRVFDLRCKYRGAAADRRQECDLIAFR